MSLVILFISFFWQTFYKSPSSIRLFEYSKIIPITKAHTSNRKNVFIKVGVVGNIENRNLPNAIEPTRNVINLIKNIPISF